MQKHANFFHLKSLEEALHLSKYRLAFARTEPRLLAKNNGKYNQLKFKSKIRRI